MFAIGLHEKKQTLKLFNVYYYYYFFFILLEITLRLPCRKGALYVKNIPKLRQYSKSLHMGVRYAMTYMMQ